MQMKYELVKMLAFCAMAFSLQTALAADPLQMANGISVDAGDAQASDLGDDGFAVAVFERSAGDRRSWRRTGWRVNHSAPTAQASPSAGARLYGY
jgi:hypothetical protein